MRKVSNKELVTVWVSHNPSSFHFTLFTFPHLNLKKKMREYDEKILEKILNGMKTLLFKDKQIMFIIDFAFESHYIVPIIFKKRYNVLFPF